MKNLLVIFAVITTSVIFGFGQNATEKTSVCTNETVEKISSRGIKIGSNLDDVLNLFASTEEEKQRIRNSGTTGDRKNVGVEFFRVSPNQNPNRINEQFDGISDYSFSFLDNRLAGFNVSYNKPRWRDTKEFVSKMVEIFGLPGVENWSIQSHRRIDLQCGNYELQADVSPEIAMSYFRVTDNRIGQILKQRKQKAEDKQREKDLKTFKP